MNSLNQLSVMEIIYKNPAIPYKEKDLESVMESISKMNMYSRYSVLCRIIEYGIMQYVSDHVPRALECFDLIHAILNIHGSAPPENPLPAIGGNMTTQFNRDVYTTFKYTDFEKIKYMAVLIAVEKANLRLDEEFMFFVPEELQLLRKI